MSIGRSCKLRLWGDARQAHTLLGPLQRADFNWARQANLDSDTLDRIRQLLCKRIYSLGTQKKTHLLPQLRCFSFSFPPTTEVTADSRHFTRNRLQCRTGKQIVKRKLLPRCLLSKVVDCWDKPFCHGKRAPPTPNLQIWPADALTTLVLVALSLVKDYRRWVNEEMRSVEEKMRKCGTKMGKKKKVPISFPAMRMKRRESLFSFFHAKVDKLFHPPRLRYFTCGRKAVFSWRRH
jgi:hypothetical protein